MISFTCFQVQNTVVSEAEIILHALKNSLSQCFVCVKRGAAGRNGVLFLYALLLLELLSMQLPCTMNVFSPVRQEDLLQSCSAAQ